MRFVFGQYVPFVASVPVLVLLGPFAFRFREAMRGVLHRVWGWKPYERGLEPPRVRALSDPREFVGGPLGTMTTFDVRDASVSQYEVLILGGLVRSAGSNATVFEIGTFEGRSAVNLAGNLMDGGRIYSLDIEDHVRESLFVEHQAQRRKVEFLRADSTRFGWEAFVSSHGPADFVFVDGGHELPLVRSDSQLAWRLVKDGGVVAWHDYDTFADVRRGVHEFLTEHGALDQAVWFRGTTLVAVRKSMSGRGSAGREG